MWPWNDNRRGVRSAVEIESVRHGRVASSWQTLSLACIGSARVLPGTAQSAPARRAHRKCTELEPREASGEMD